MSLDSLPAEQAAMTLEEISQALEELLAQWQECVKQGECPPEKSTDYYNRAAKLIDQKKVLQNQQGKPMAPIAPAAEPTPEPAPPVEAKANGHPPKKTKKKKAAADKPKVSLAMTPETQFAEVPPAPADAAQAVKAILGDVPPPTPPVIDSYGDAQALADGVLVDVSPFKVEIKGVPVTRMTTTIFARMTEAVKQVEAESAQMKVPFVLAVAERNWMVSQIKQAVIKGDILQVPRTPTSGAIWIMENEGGGFTFLSPHDY